MVRACTGRSLRMLRWSGGAKVSCILRHLGVQLILAYSWARPAILVAGKVRWGIFLFLLFLHFHSCSSFFPVPLFHLFYYLFYHLSPNRHSGSVIERPLCDREVAGSIPGRVIPKTLKMVLAALSLGAQH